MITTSHRAKIDGLIAEANDPEKRAILMVLASIDDGLTANTEATRMIATEMKEHRAQFDVHLNEFATHVQDEKAILIAVKWGWWSATGMGAMVLALGWYVVTAQIQSINADSLLMRNVIVRMGVIESQLADLRKAKE